MKTIAAALLAMLLTSTATHAAPPAQSTCRLRNETREIVVIVSGPCWKRDFPKNCKIPATVTRGQRVYCPMEKPALQTPVRM